MKGSKIQVKGRYQYVEVSIGYFGIIKQSERQITPLECQDLKEDHCIEEKKKKKKKEKIFLFFSIVLL